MSFPAVLDTCVLYPVYLCDALLTLAEDGTYRPLWSADILIELQRNLERRIPEPAAERRVAQMRQFFEDAEVTGYEPLIEGMTNAPEDRHVLAAAVCGGAEVIVTANISDFAAKDLKPFNLDAVTPDDFLLDQLDLYPRLTIEALKRQAARYRREPRTVAGLLGILDRSGVPQFAAEVRRHLMLRRPQRDLRRVRLLIVPHRMPTANHKG